MDPRRGEGGEQKSNSIETKQTQEFMIKELFADHFKEVERV